MKKKIVLIGLLAATLCTSAIAQKIFVTKSGQITFDASATTDIKAVNNQVDSKIVEKTGQMVFSVLIKSFKFPNALMEDHFNENYMESTKFPKADFKGYITNISAVNFEKDGVYPATAEGMLTIHGVSKKITVPGTISVEGGKPVLKADFKVKLKDYITGSYIGSQIAEDAKLAINCKYE
ncbi:YceI family protein [Parasediminibacterium sp. JCM 36343]|uniref:YceI family protein n=1 Tax=Parasediminibacterium sp. JCM 36343 TaxID=3374279 RepID=UPI003979261B